VASAAPHRLLAVFAPCAAGLLLSCSTAAPPPGASANSGAASAMAAAGSNSAGGVGNGEGGTAGGSVSPEPTQLLPARIRRLASPEYDATVQALLSTAQRPASGPDFPPDLRQDGFTVNDAQRVDEVIIERLADAADALASEARQNGTLARLAPCAPSSEPTSCAKRFISEFGTKVYRRPLSSDEESALLALFSIASEGASYEDGIAHVTRGLLQSAGFLYLTEVGAAATAPEGVIELTPHEVASSLSYFLTSAPPDDELLAKATTGALADPLEREAQARRIFQKNPLAKDTVVRLVREWLGIDGIAGSAKDSLIYPDFEREKPKMLAESEDFVRAVAFDSTGTISELFNAKWTVNSGPLAMYETAGNGPLDGSTALTDRVGILNQAAFLATYANAHESHPIFRGVAIARRVTCYPLDSPASFNLQVVPPAPDPTKTTRERFSVHPADSICSGCHDIIDPYGFSFEHFDGMGAYRAQENGKTVDSSVEVDLMSDFDGPYADSNQLAAALGQSESVRECFARFMFRAAAASGDSAATPGETEFVNLWRALPAAAQGNIVETLIAYVKSPTFTTRWSR